MLLLKLGVWPVLMFGVPLCARLLNDKTYVAAAQAFAYAWPPADLHAPANADACDTACAPFAQAFAHATTGHVTSMPCATLLSSPHDSLL